MEPSCTFENWKKIPSPKLGARTFYWASSSHLATGGRGGCDPEKKGCKRYVNIILTFSYDPVSTTWKICFVWSDQKIWIFLNFFHWHIDWHMLTFWALLTVLAPVFSCRTPRIFYFYIPWRGDQSALQFHPSTGRIHQLARWVLRLKIPHAQTQSPRNPEAGSCSLLDMVLHS